MTQVLICQDDGGLMVLTDPRPAVELAALINAAGGAAANAAWASAGLAEGAAVAQAAARVIAYTQPALGAGAPWMAAPLGGAVLVFHPARAGTDQVGSSPTPTLPAEALLPGESAPAAPEISPRQRQVLELLAEGTGDGSIARRLGVSQRTVRAYIAGLRERLGAANREQMLARAVALGLVRPSLGQSDSDGPG